MPDGERHYENDSIVRAELWLADVRIALEVSSGPNGVDPTDERFVLRIERGMQISDKRLEYLATMQDRREAFLQDTGADPLLEQFFAYKAALM